MGFPARRQPGLAVSESPGLIAGLDDMTMMGQTVEQGGGHLGIAKDVTSLGEGQIGRDAHAGALVELREQMEEQGAACLTERQIAQFIENHQIDIHQPIGHLPRFARSLLRNRPVITVFPG